MTKKEIVEYTKSQLNKYQKESLLGYANQTLNLGIDLKKKKPKIITRLLQAQKEGTNLDLRHLEGMCCY